MSAGTYQPIKVWDLEGFRSGALPYIESASLAATNGAPCTIDTNGRLAEAGTTFIQAHAILSGDGSNASSAGATIQAIPIRPDVIFEVTLNEAFAQNQLGKSYGLVKDGTTKNWYLSTADIGNQMYIVGQHPATNIGDTKMRVLARFNQNAIQAWYANAPNVSILANSGAITPAQEGTYVINKAGIAAITLAAPAAGTDDGKRITITSDSANAHTVTCPASVFKNGGAAVTIFTFTGTTSGGGLSLIAYNATWKVLASTGGAFS